jgi:hypothetical protein
MNARELSGASGSLAATAARLGSIGRDWARRVPVCDDREMSWAVRTWWVVGVVATGALGCAGTTVGVVEEEWPEQEQSCGGTGEEELERMAAAGCAWPRGGCEVTALGVTEAGGRVGTLRLTAAETGALGPAWEAWLTGAPAETLALARDADGGLRALSGCRLGVGMTAAPAVSPHARPAWVAAEQLVAAPALDASSPCDGATHFVAVARGDEGVALPLACPPLSFAGAPRSCVAAGLTGDAREAWGRALYTRADEAYQSGDYPRAFDGFLTLRALMPDSHPAHHNLLQAIERLAEPSCAHRDAVERARQQLPDDGSLARPATALCIPAPPLLGCLSEFVSPPSPDHC